MTTGALWDEKYMWWDTRSAGAFIPAGGWIEPDEHAENPRTKRRLKNLLDASGLWKQLQWLDARPATVEELCRVHDEDYVRRMEQMSAAGGGDAGELVPFGPGGYDIARLAAGGAIVAAEAVHTRTVDNAYALVRPPGHHAERDRGRGFCMFGNVAIAARHLQAVHGVRRIAVVDWDVHHGNGTQQAFYGDADVLTVSLHQDSYYPHESGAGDETGEGAGAGTNLNVPLPPGTGVGGYLYAMETLVVPALRRFAPDFVFVASGFDSSALDPLGRQMLHSDAYREMTRMVGDVAAETAGGRLLVVHEGGYSAAYVPFCGLATIEQLSGVRTGVEDPFLDFLSAIGGMDLQPHQKDVVDALSPVVDAVPTA
ncbi:Acetoin utilization deacetylase AcuC [Geodermatophilus saharensis]|uniref:Acetoin utilization deacetylase AcuC n=1 Tax=Geodermatophilus saharensis TaxID=1137994 RepID=A0A239CU34_9ACTN|nr:class II histone deacetylase [Geodermatophilus saharensis]SNS23288.1 Acetoin utilization deacetylase AcuC [Geodermatophilus saharensis]